MSFSVILHKKHVQFPVFLKRLQTSATARQPSNWKCSKLRVGIRRSSPVWNMDVAWLANPCLLCDSALMPMSFLSMVIDGKKLIENFWILIFKEKNNSSRWSELLLPNSRIWWVMWSPTFEQLPPGEKSINHSHNCLCCWSPHTLRLPYARLDKDCWYHIFW